MQATTKQASKFQQKGMTLRIGAGGKTGLHTTKEKGTLKNVYRRTKKSFEGERQLREWVIANKDH